MTLPDDMKAFGTGLQTEFESLEAQARERLECSKWSITGNSAIHDNNLASQEEKDSPQSDKELVWNA
jgi:hypothetical protein